MIVTDREVTEIEDGRRKELEKRKMGRNGRLANLVARYADRSDVGRFPDRSLEITCGI